MKAAILSGLMCLSILGQTPARLDGPALIDSSCTSDVMDSLEEFIFDLTSLLGEARRNAKAVWRPGRDCWVVYERCDALERHRGFATMMTGPGGRLKISVQASDANDATLVPVDPNDIWSLGYPDQDLDGDIDLKDFAWILAPDRIARDPPQ